MIWAAACRFSSGWSTRYLLSMGALILPGGSISDLFGRVRVMRFGLAAFGAGSVLAATASSPVSLVAARAIQGLGAAFLVPGSLALINSTFDRAAQPAAIGTWTAWTGTAFALGPLLGGLAVDMLTWRWIYALSAIPMVVGFALTYWLCPMQAPSEHPRVDVRGAVLSAVGLAAGVYGLIESQQRGWTDPVVAASIAMGAAMLLLFPGLGASRALTRWFPCACSRFAILPVPTSPPPLSMEDWPWDRWSYPSTSRKSAAIRRPLLD